MTEINPNNSFSVGFCIHRKGGQTHDKLEITITSDTFYALIGSKVETQNTDDIIFKVENETTPGSGTYQPAGKLDKETINASKYRLVISINLTGKSFKVQGEQLASKILTNSTKGLIKFFSSPQIEDTNKLKIALKAFIDKCGIEQRAVLGMERASDNISNFLRPDQYDKSKLNKVPADAPASGAAPASPAPAPAPALAPAPAPAPGAAPAAPAPASTRPELGSASMSATIRPPTSEDEKKNEIRKLAESKSIETQTQFAEAKAAAAAQEAKAQEAAAQEAAAAKEAAAKEPAPASPAQTGALYTDKSNQPGFMQRLGSAPASEESGAAPASNLWGKVRDKIGLGAKNSSGDKPAPPSSGGTKSAGRRPNRRRKSAKKRRVTANL
jgi:hypothetical protein